MVYPLADGDSIMQNCICCTHTVNAVPCFFGRERASQEEGARMTLAGWPKMLKLCSSAVWLDIRKGIESVKSTSSTIQQDLLQACRNNWLIQNCRPLSFFLRCVAQPPLLSHVQQIICFQSDRFCANVLRSCTHAPHQSLAGLPL